MSIEPKYRKRLFAAGAILGLVGITGVGVTVAANADSDRSQQWEMDLEDYEGIHSTPQQPQQRFVTVCSGGQPKVVSDWGRVVHSEPITCRQVPAG